MSESSNKHGDFNRRLLASGPRLRAYIRPIIFDPSVADALMQDITSTAAKAFNSYDPKQPFDAWLMGVAHNCALLFLDNPRTRPKGIGRETLKQLEAISFQAAAQADVLQDALDHCLPKLTKTDGLLITQRFKKGATNETVARLQKVNAFTVSYALNRVFEKLLVAVNRPSRGQNDE